LEIDEKGEYVAGWEQIKNSLGILAKGKKLLQEEIAKYNELPYVPRALSFKNKSSYLTSHECLFKLLKTDNKQYYRGFSVIPGDEPIFLWNSSSMNSFLSFHKVPGIEQQQIKEIISNW